MAPSVATYEPRDPSRTVLYHVIADHLGPVTQKLRPDLIEDVVSGYPRKAGQLVVGQVR